VRKMRHHDEYSDYITHQKEKTTDPVRRKKWVTEEWELKIDGFDSVFNEYKDTILTEGKKALCIGARTGQEVVSLNKLGVDAIGIDIVPHPPHVIECDMHNLQFQDETFDFVYSNVFDHSLFPQRMISEIERVLKDGGHSLIQFAIGDDLDEYTEHEVDDVDGDVLPFYKQSECVKSHAIPKNFAAMNWEVLSRKDKSLLNKKVSTINFTDRDGGNIEVSLSPGDIVVDCGANVGDVSAAFANHGAIVIAFEPNGIAFKTLKERFTTCSNVKCYNSAVSNESGVGKLYLHENASSDPLTYSTGSSLESAKENVNDNDFEEVKLVDLSEAIENITKTFKRSIHVLKIDIEGAECKVMEKLMDKGLLSDIKHVFVETHEIKNPAFARDTKKMIERATKEGLTNVNFNWI